MLKNSILLIEYIRGTQAYYVMMAALIVFQLEEIIIFLLPNTDIFFVNDLKDNEFRMTQ